MKNKKIRLLVIFLTLIVIAMITSISVYAALSKTKTGGVIEASTVEVSAEAEYVSSTNSFSWTYNKAGDSKNITVRMSNNSTTVLRTYHTLSYKDTSTELAKAILVYFNGEYIGTLNQLCGENPKGIRDNSLYIGKSGMQADVFKFELHQAAINSIYKTQSITLNINSYTETADYSNNMFVYTEDEFKKAVDDVNTGMLINTPTVSNGSLTGVPQIIILSSDLNIKGSYTFTKSAIINLNKKAQLRGGSIAINNAEAVLDVINAGTLLTPVSATSFNTEKAEELIVSKFTKSINGGLAANSTVDVIDSLSFYNLTLTGSTNVEVSGNYITTGSVSTTAVETIKVGSTNVSFKLYGTKTALVDSVLAHLPDDDTEITKDLFLPTSILSSNATIIWTSSRPDIIDNTGKIVAKFAEAEIVTLYAEIKINNTVYTRSFRYEISAHNNEINFYSLVQEISPLVIYNIMESDADAAKAKYYLPIVSYNTSTNTFNNYDYRKDYSAPETDPSYMWKAYRELGLISLEYSISNSFDFITLSGNSVWLNRNTLNTYAELTVTGTFEDLEQYSSIVNISISVGTNTQLLDQAINNAKTYIEDVDILARLLETRIESGMNKENADFILPATYYDSKNKATYTYGYAVPAGSSGAISGITAIEEDGVVTGYKIHINPENFSSYESLIPINVTANYSPTIYKTVSIFFNVPAVLKSSDFGNVSIFNSIKYQVYTSLPDDEKAGDSGYNKTSTTLTNSNLDYILLRDVLGDVEYSKTNTTYLEKINSDIENEAFTAVSEFVKATGTTELHLYTQSSSASTTDQLAYNFVRLIEWATSDKTVTAESIVSGTGSTKSDGYEYLSEEEREVLKTYYVTYSGGTEADWNTLIANNAKTASGYLLQDSDALTTAIGSAFTNLSNFYDTGGSTTDKDLMYFKHLEIQLYVEDKTNRGTDIPNYNTARYYTWSNSSGTLAFTDDKGVSWYYTSSTNSEMPGSKYYSDNTGYISEGELFFWKCFWLNAILASSSGYQGGSNNRLTYAKNIVNTFDTAMVKPTTFNSDGIANLVNSFYEKAKNKSTNAIKLAKYDTSTYKASGQFVSGVRSNYPTVTNLDSIGTGLNYFTKLTTLDVQGNTNLSAFIETGTLSQFFTRVSMNNSNVTSLTMKNCANNYVEFDLTNIKNLKSLTSIDVSYNKGITKPAALINAVSNSYTYINMAYIGADYDLSEFTINSFNTDATVVYTTAYDLSLSTVTRNSATAYNTVLNYLNDMSDLIAQNMYLTDVIYDESGSTTDVYWRIETGNGIKTITAGVTYPEISSADEMNYMISPYYYCTTSFYYDNYQYEAGNIYKYTCDSMGSIEVSKISIDMEVADIDSISGSGLTDEYMATYTPTIDTQTNVEEIEYNDSTLQSSTYLIEDSNFNTIKITFYYIKYGNRYVCIDNSGLNITSSSSDAEPFLIVTSKDTVTTVKNYFSAYDAEWIGEAGIINSDVSYGDFTADATTEYIFYGYKSGKYIGNGTPGASDEYKQFPVSDDNPKGLVITSGGTIRSKTQEVSKYSGVFNSKRTDYYNYLAYSDETSKTSAKIQIVHGKEQDGNNHPDFTFEKDIDRSIDRKSVKNQSEFTITYSDGSQSSFKGIISLLVQTYKKSYEDQALGNVKRISEISHQIIKYAYSNEMVYKCIFNYQIEGNYIFQYKSISGYRMFAKITYVDKYGVSHVVEDYNIAKVAYVMGFKGSWSNDYNLNCGTYDNRDSVEFSDWYCYDSDNNLILATEEQIHGSWIYKEKQVSLFINYITEIEDESNLSARKKIIELVANRNYLKYIFTGSYISTNLYWESTTPTVQEYYNGSGYYFSLNEKGLYWIRGTNLTQTSGDTMDSVLASANSAYNSPTNYGKYYGMYYAYTGDSVTSSNTYYAYIKNHIYRLMPNDSKTGFVWIDKGTFTTTDNVETIYGVIRNGNGASILGNIYYLTNLKTTAASNTYAGGEFYIISYNTENKTYFLKSFENIGFSSVTNSGTTVIDFVNSRIYKDGTVQYVSNKYSGRGGTETVRVSATIRINGVEYVRTFEFNVVGHAE